ncbi:MAG: alpha/beta fold hydrolase, partial [Candidatus Thorarchaeota archaeon]
MQNIIFIHGLESSGKGFKGRFFKTIFPDILTPDFKKFDPNVPMYDLFRERMSELSSILNQTKNWIIIGSSFGGLMGAIYTLENPDNVKRLILLAPFLVSRKLKPTFYKAVGVPVIIFHGKNDTVVRYKPSQERAKTFFTNLQYYIL